MHASISSVHTSNFEAHEAANWCAHDPHDLNDGWITLLLGQLTSTRRAFIAMRALFSMDIIVDTTSHSELYCLMESTCHTHATRFFQFKVANEDVRDGSCFSCNNNMRVVYGPVPSSFGWT